MDAFVKRTKREWSSSELNVRRELAFVCFLIETNSSFRLAENEYLAVYHTLSNGAAPPPNRRRVSDVLIPLLHGFVVQHQQIDLRKIDTFAMSADGWTNDYNEQFIAVNVHFILPTEFQPRVALLDMFALPERHTWQNVAHGIAVVLENRMPSTSLLTTTVTDNAATMLKVGAALHTNLPAMAIEQLIGGDYESPIEQEDLDPTALFPCVAHKAQLAALDVMGADGDAPASIVIVIDRVRAVVKAIRNSQKLVESLKLRCVELNIKYFKPILDVKTRWLSCWMMGNTAFQLHRAILRMAVLGAFDDETYDELQLPTPSDWKIVEFYSKLLKPMADFVETLEGELYVTIAHAPVLFLRARAEMADLPSDDVSIRLLKLRLRTAWDARLGFLVSKPNLALVAAALHPKYAHLQFISAPLRAEVGAAIVDWGHEFAAASAAALPPVRAAVSLSTPIIIRAAPSRTKDFLKAEYADYANHWAHQAVPANVLALATSKVDEDPMAFWKANQSVMPSLCTVARIVLAVPATSAAPERTFSRAGNLSRRRGRLSGVRLSQITVISYFLNQLVHSEAKLSRDEEEPRSAVARRAAEKFLDWCLHAMNGKA